MATPPSTDASNNDSSETLPIKIGIIGGTGLEAALGIDPEAEPDTYFPDTPFGKPSAPIIQTQWHDVDVCILKRHGIGHVYPPSHVPYQANIFALKELGVTHIIASGATGSLREHIHPGELVIIDQVIDKTYKRANSFFEKAAVHVELADPMCPIMRRWLLEAAERVGVVRVASDEGSTADRSSQGNAAELTVHASGTYVVMEGPAFSTRAESEMHRSWGGDVIGMTLMPECKLAREAEIAYAMVCLPTDYDCWKTDETYGSHDELLSIIIENLNKASAAGIKLIKAALEDTTMLATKPSPAHTALKLGIWSDKAQIDADEMTKLNPLWGKYF